MSQFLEDVIKGLNSSPKYLDSKYFYDKKGDELFQEIMACPEYYPTKSEMEVFALQKDKIADVVLSQGSIFDYVGFGPGDAVKSTHLLKELWRRKGLEYFFPIDISENIISYLQKAIPEKIPGLKVHGLQGEYLNMLPKTNAVSNHKRLIGFLGGNIGNFKFDEMPSFLKELNHQLRQGDMVLIGFDLKKNPYQILAAYNDKGGITSRFNLNLLTRINRELGADFEVDSFQHYNSYDPDTGACKSFLFSTKKQTVRIGEYQFHFEKDETIYMEISQKYSLNQIDEIAVECGFTPVEHFFDKQKWFVDVLWRKDFVR
ncbi:MAG: L-histidine N(alpha)-methyltransferase [Ginsengibacter sp.]